MLVDLGRNDLGRVCEYGTVSGRRVHGRSRPTRTSSTSSARSRARCATGSAAMDVLRATLPAGTLSGAPKVRAMQIIDELEPHKRCSYGGAIGYLGLHRRPRHGDPHPHGRRQGRARPRPGRRRHRRRREARLRVPRERQQGEGDVRGGRAGRAPAGVGMTACASSSSTTTTPSPTTSSSTWASSGAEVEVRAQRQGDRRRAARARPDRLVISPGPCTPGRGRDLDRGVARLPRGRDPDARRLPRPPGDGRGVRRPDDPRRADPRQGRRDLPRRRGLFAGLPNPLRAGRYHSLVADPDAAGGARADRALRRRGDGRPPPRRCPPAGVQFHPESVLTPDGKALLANFLSADLMPNDILTRAIDEVASGSHLTADHASAVLDEVMEGRAGEVQTGGLPDRAAREGRDGRRARRAWRGRCAGSPPRSRPSREDLVDTAGHRRRPVDLQHLDRRGAGRRRRRLRRRQARQPLQHEPLGLGGPARGARGQHRARPRGGRRGASTRSASASCSRRATTRR